MPRKVAALNLNLLVVLDALLAERSVTRAGSRIGLSQPATSAALARLRGYFDDDLLVRNGRGYELTRVALGLADPVREVIMTVERSITGRDSFDPATADREFSIAVSDYVLMTLVPALLPAVARIAPRVRLRIVPAELAVRGGPSGTADLYVTPLAFTFPESEQIFATGGYSPSLRLIPPSERASICVRSSACRRCVIQSAGSRTPPRRISMRSGFRAGRRSASGVLWPHFFCFAAPS